MYIKLFENFNAFRLLDNNEKLNYRISINDDEIGEEKFSKNEISQIILRSKLPWNKKIIRERSKGIILVVGNQFGGDRLIVRKLPDEWFIVEVQIGGSAYINDYGSGWYKCDQLDGLIDCINYLSDKYEQLSISKNDSNGYFYRREDHYKVFPNV